MEVLQPSDVVQSGDARTTSANTKTIPGITEIFEDEKNYYICSSGFPVGRTVFFNQTILLATLQLINPY